MLRRRYLIMLCFGIDAKLPELFIQLLHKSSHARLDTAKIVVVQLLAFGRHGAEQRTAAEAQILTLRIQIQINQKIFLLWTNSGDHA